MFLKEWGTAEKISVDNKGIWKLPKKYVDEKMVVEQKSDKPNFRNFSFATGFEEQTLEILFHNLKNKKLSIFIGPEGDFSLSEIKKAIEKGCKPVSFGNTRLRTETAALYACASVAAQNESE